MAFFAIQVKTGQESKAARNLKQNLEDSKIEAVKNVKKIYSLDTCTTFIKGGATTIQTEDITADMTQQEKEKAALAETIATSLSNLRIQLNELNNKNDEHSNKLKTSLKQDIELLENELKKYKTPSKKMKALLPGYIMIEMDLEGDILPDEIWHIIKSTPAVIAIPSRFNMPDEEIHQMFNATTVHGDVEIDFGKALTQEEIIAQQKVLIQEANSTSDRQEQDDLMECAQSLSSDLITEVEKVKKSSKNGLDKVKAYIRNKKKTVSLPVSLFKKLYKGIEKSNTPLKITEKGLISRLKRLLEPDIGEAVLE